MLVPQFPSFPYTPVHFVPKSCYEKCDSLVTGTTRYNECVVGCRCPDQDKCQYWNPNCKHF